MPIQDADKAKDVFDIAIKSYIIPDIKELLSNTEKAGPLFLTVTSGIDTMGGILEGFSAVNGNGNSSTRSCNFMVQKMNIPRKLASLVYTHGRCGAVHEGGIKGGVSLERDENNLEIFNRDNNERLVINVYQLAKKFIETVEKIEASNLMFIPDFKTVLFDDIKNLVVKSESTKSSLSPHDYSQ